MAIIRGIHILAKGNREEARRIAEDIQRHQRLLVGSNTWYRAGVYAWFEEDLPDRLHSEPQVIFEIDESLIVRIPTSGKSFFRIPGPIHTYVSIRVVGFANLQ